MPCSLGSLPIPLIQFPAPFDDLDFLYEVKFDGFRALAYVDDGTCELVSRKGHVYRTFATLCQSTFGLVTQRSASCRSSLIAGRWGTARLYARTAIASERERQQRGTPDG